jgi:protein-disulfide isomerase
MSKQFVLILAALVVLFGGILFFTKRDAGAPNGENGNGGTTTNHTLGEGTSGVTLVEYADFECPACYRFYPVLKELKEKYQDQITFQYKHFPLTEIHQSALLAARASEAAANQGKFWEMHDLLFQNQPIWSQQPNQAEGVFRGYAEQLGLNMEQYDTDLKSSETNRIIQADRNEARRNGYNSTPTFILDGQQLTDVRDTVEYFSEKIDAAIAEKANN